MEEVTLWWLFYNPTLKVISNQLRINQSNRRGAPLWVWEIFFWLIPQDRMDALPSLWFWGPEFSNKILAFPVGFCHLYQVPVSQGFKTFITVQHTCRIVYKWKMHSLMNFFTKWLHLCNQHLNQETWQHQHSRRPSSKGTILKIKKTK